MREEHRADGERAETEFRMRHHFPSPANRTAPMPEAELPRDDEDIAILLSRDEVHGFDHLRGCADSGSAYLSFTVVGEAPRCGNLRETIFTASQFRASGSFTLLKKRAARASTEGMANHPSAQSGSVSVGNTFSMNSIVLPSENPKIFAKMSIC